MQDPELFRRIAGADFVQDASGMQSPPLAGPLLLPIARAFAAGGERRAAERRIARRGDEINAARDDRCICKRDFRRASCRSRCRAR
jgi:hypothetical protein